MKKTIRKLIAYLTVVLMATSLFSCDNEDDTGDLYPVSPENKAEWLSRMNGDVQSLRNAVLAIQGNDSITRIQIDDNVYQLEFVSTPPVHFMLDNAAYSSPLIGAHKIDNDYYWTQIIGSGTSATTLIKDENRSNYKIEEGGISPMFDISESGNWMIIAGNSRKEVLNSEGKKFRAIGTKALFSSITFDNDSNAVITTNEQPERSYILPKYRPFTFRLLSAAADTVKVASGFTVPLDFISSGIVSFEYTLPKAWSVEYTFAEDRKSGSLLVTAPTGMEAEYDARGSIVVYAVNAYGDKLMKKIPVKCEVGLINYASVEFADIAVGLSLKAASFVFANESMEDERPVTVIKVGNKFRVMLPEGYPIFKKAVFTTDDDDTFTYYFNPKQTLSIGEQSLSIAPPQLLSYWQGGIVVVVNETLPLSGVEAYKITGTVMAPALAPKLNWFPNGNVDVTTANSETDGATNTAEIIKALGGPGTTAGFIARWAIRVKSGGYTDWYLGVGSEYMAFNTLWKQDKAYFNDLMITYGGEDQKIIEGTHNVFWTSTNINKTQARAYDMRNGGTITAGTKIYGCHGFAFRKID